MSSKPPLDLVAEVMTPDRVRYRWDANQAPGNIPTGLTFRTKVGEGFSDASLNLARRIDFNYPDLELVNYVTLAGVEGSTAYEGRIAAMPRELGDSHSIGVSMVGHMAHARDKKFTEIYVDRDMSGWTGPSAARKALMLGANFVPIDPDQTIDPTDSQAGLTTHIDGAWSSPYVPTSEAYYDAGPGNVIGVIGYIWARESTNVGTAAPWTWGIGVSSDDKLSALDTTANLAGAGPSGLQSFTPTARYRYAIITFNYASTPAGTAGARYGVNWYKLAVYGAHGVTLRAGEPGEHAGVYASDVIENIVGRWCPQLNTGGVTDTTYTIQHLSFKDGVFPFDAFLEVNKYHLWHLGVWENRTLHFRPYDLTDYKWDIRTDEAGVTFQAQGSSTDDLFNGIVVTYSDIISRTRYRLDPGTYSDLRDTDPDNPWNRHGVDHWDEIELSAPTTFSQAVQIGRAALGERNRPKAPGTVTVKGWVRDQGGNWNQAWKIRAGDTIALTNEPNNSPRLVHETTWDDDTKTATLAIDAPAATLDAYLDRVGNALAARNLS